jgi:hypothetical protein
MDSGPLLIPMQLGFNGGFFEPHINSREPCYFTKFPDGLQTYTLNVLWFQKKRNPDTQVVEEIKTHILFPVTFFQNSCG